MTSFNTKTIVFIHGLFVNPKSWVNWKVFFENKGFTCFAPANPYHEGEPSFLMKNIDPNLARVDFEDVINNLIHFIDGLPERPILIGHSLAGLAVQKLISLDKGVVGICIDGAPPVGIITTKWSFWKATFLSSIFSREIQFSFLQKAGSIMPLVTPFRVPTQTRFSKN